MSGHIETYLTRSDWSATFPTAPTEEDRTVGQELIDSMSLEAYIGSGTEVDLDKPWYSARKPRQKRSPMDYGSTEYKLYDLIGKSYDCLLYTSYTSAISTMRPGASPTGTPGTMRR